MCRAWAGTLLVTTVSLVSFAFGCGTSQIGPTAAARQSDITAEEARQALLELLEGEDHPDAATLTPLYFEPPPATPPVRTATPWPPSPKST